MFNVNYYRVFRKKSNKNISIKNNSFSQIIENQRLTHQLRSSSLEIDSYCNETNSQKNMLDQLKEQNSKLSRENHNLETQVKELQLQLENKSFSDNIIFCMFYLN